MSCEFQRRKEREEQNRKEKRGEETREWYGIQRHAERDTPCRDQVA
jgi:hypothetical protein